MQRYNTHKGTFDGEGVAAVKLKPHNFRVKTVNDFTVDRKQIRPVEGKSFLS
jgi:hypothetical protein